MDAVEIIWKVCAQAKVDIEVVESFLRPENLEVSPRYVLKHALNEKRQQYFPALRYIRKAEPLCGMQKTMVGKPGKRRCTAGEWAEQGMTLSIKGQGKSPAVPRQNPTNAPASAKLVISKRRRRPLGLDGRQAKAKGCLREPGQGNAEIP